MGNFESSFSHFNTIRLRSNPKIERSEIGRSCVHLPFCQVSRAIHNVVAQQTASSIRNLSKCQILKSYLFRLVYLSERSTISDQRSAINDKRSTIKSFHLTSSHLSVSESIDFPCVLKNLTWTNCRFCATWHFSVECQTSENDGIIWPSNSLTVSRTLTNRDL
jgi:hypothetical protein